LIFIKTFKTKIVAHGSPITKSSPALIDGINPSEPTSAAAASLTKNQISKAGAIGRLLGKYLRKNIAI
jgi:hypothetical protein